MKEGIEIMLEFYSRELKSFLGMFIEYIRNNHSEYSINSLLRINNHEQIMSAKTYRKLREGAYFKDEDLFDQLIYKLGYSKNKMSYAIKTFFDCSENISKAMQNFQIDEVLRNCNAFKIKTSDLNSNTFALKELTQIIEMIERVICEFGHLDTKDAALLEDTYEIFRSTSVYEVINDLLFRYYAFTIMDTHRFEALETELKDSDFPSNQIYYTRILCRKHQYIEALTSLQMQMEHYYKSNNMNAYTYTLFELIRLDKYFSFGDSDCYSKQLLLLLEGERIDKTTKANLYYELAVLEFEYRDYKTAVTYCEKSFALSGYRKLECYILISYIYHFYLKKAFPYNLNEINTDSLVGSFYNYYVKKNQNVDVAKLERYLVGQIYPILKTDTYLYKLFAYELYDIVRLTRNYKNLMLLKISLE